MSNSKQKILSELKSKLSQFKSKMKCYNEMNEKKVGDDLILKVPFNKDIISNKENIDNNSNSNIFINNPIKTPKMERVNSTGITSFNATKKFLDFDVDKLFERNKKHSFSKTNINLDELNINRNKSFININLNSKTLSKTDRNKVVNNRFNNIFINKYGQNYTEPNIDSYKKQKAQNNHFNFNYEANDNIIIPLSLNNRNERGRLSAKPEIKTDTSRYNLNFFLNNNKSINRKNKEKLFNNNYNNINESYSINIKNILYSNNRKSNFNLLNGLNNKYLKTSNTTYNYNNYNLYNNYNKATVKKNIFNELENNKSYNTNLNMDEINKVKYMIQHLSNEEINNMPISVFKEMKDLYDLIYQKFLRNNFI